MLSILAGRPKGNRWQSTIWRVLGSIHRTQSGCWWQRTGTMTTFAGSVKFSDVLRKLVSPAAVPSEPPSFRNCSQWPTADTISVGVRGWMKFFRCLRNSSAETSPRPVWPKHKPFFGKVTGRRHPLSERSHLLEKRRWPASPGCLATKLQSLDDTEFRISGRMIPPSFFPWRQGEQRFCSVPTWRSAAPRDWGGVLSSAMRHPTPRLRNASRFPIMGRLTRTIRTFGRRCWHLSPWQHFRLSAGETSRCPAERMLAASLKGHPERTSRQSHTSESIVTGTAPLKRRFGKSPER